MITAMMPAAAGTPINMAKKTFIIDLDNTIFDTKAFREDIFAFFRELGISETQIRDSYDVLAKDGGYDYSIEIHLNQIKKMCGIDISGFDGKVEVFKEKDLARFVRANVFDVLERMKKNGHKIVLFSKGNAVFQDLKLVKSGLKRYFDEIVIVRPDQMKEDVLKDVKIEGEAYFINDNWPETEKVIERFPGLNYILFVRPPAERLYNIDEVPISKIGGFGEVEKII